MDILTMRNKFIERTSGFADDLSNSQIDEFLNRWYQFVIPSTTGFDLTDGLWNQELTSLTDSYDYPSYVITPRTKGRPWIAARRTDGLTDPTIISTSSVIWLDVETDPAVFQFMDREHPTDTVTGGQPEALLFYRRRMVVSPAPDEHYFINIPARMGPSTPLGDESGEQDGIDNEIHAMAVITGAAQELLLDKEDELGAAKEGRSHEFWVTKLVPWSQGKTRHRRPRMSY